MLSGEPGEALFEVLGELSAGEIEVRIAHLGSEGEGGEGGQAAVVPEALFLLLLGQPSVAAGDGLPDFLLDGGVFIGGAGGERCGGDESEGEECVGFHGVRGLSVEYVAGW